MERVVYKKEITLNNIRSDSIEGEIDYLQSRWGLDYKAIKAYVFELVEQLTRYELLVLCQSYCASSVSSHIDTNNFLEEIQDIEQKRNIIIFSYLFPFLRQTALEVLSRAIIERCGIDIVSNIKRKTSISHTEFQSSIAEYLAFEMPEKKHILFEEHMLACDYCAELLFINHEIIRIIKDHGNELLLTLYFSKKENDMEKINIQVPEIALVKRCVKSLILEVQPQELLQNLRDRVKSNQYIDILKAINQKVKIDLLNNVQEFCFDNGNFIKELIRKEKNRYPSFSSINLNSLNKRYCDISQGKDERVKKIIFICILIANIPGLNRLLVRILPYLSRITFFSRLINISFI